MLPVIFKSARETLQKHVGDGNIIDTASTFVFVYFTVLICPLCPLALGHALSCIPKITLAKDLPWPRNGNKLVISLFSVVFGLSATMAVYWAETLEDEKEFSQDILVPFSLLIWVYFMTTFCWMFPTLLVAALMEKFISICEDQSDRKESTHAKSCLELRLRQIV